MILLIFIEAVECTYLYKIDNNRTGLKNINISQYIKKAKFSLYPMFLMFIYVTFLIQGICWVSP